MKKFRILVTLVILAAISVTLYIAASENTINSEDLSDTPAVFEKTISPGMDIGEAFDSLPDGGRLIFSEGVYDTTEAIVLEGRKNLTLEGTGEVWINTKGIDHHVITLRGCQNMTLSNLKAQHVILEEGDNDPIQDARDGAVIGILDSAGITLNHCELVGCGIYGVYAYSATPLILEGCYLHDNAEYALLLETGAKPMDVVVRDCVITQNAGSIKIKGDITVKREGNNRIEQNTPGDYH